MRALSRLLPPPSRHQNLHPQFYEDVKKQKNKQPQTRLMGELECFRENKDLQNHFEAHFSIPMSSHPALFQTKTMYKPQAKLKVTIKVNTPTLEKKDFLIPVCKTIRINIQFRSHLYLLELELELGYAPPLLSVSRFSRPCSPLPLLDVIVPSSSRPSTEPLPLSETKIKKKSVPSLMLGSH